MNSDLSNEKKLAIIVSVSDYPKPNELPGCAADGVIMKTLIHESKKFDEILYILGTVQSAKAKEQIAEFVSRHKEDARTTSEVFFYFSGHGKFKDKDEEFYHLFSDYDFKKDRQTSLTTTELDGLLKSLNPTLTVKVIDACYSGVSYIKDVEKITKYLDGSKSRFKKCYFLFSSTTSQGSFQNNEGSAFTKSLARAVVTHPASSIRYHAVMDFISDEFADDADQNPFFVVQADYNEIFCQLSDDLRKALSQFKQIAPVNVKDIEEGNETTDPAKKVSDLVKFVIQESQDYCTEKEAFELSNNFLESIKKCERPADVNDLFDFEFQIPNDEDTIFNVSEIGRWLSENKHDLLVSIIYGADPFYAASTISVFMPRVPVGIEVKSPEKLSTHIIGIASPKFPGLSGGLLMVVPLVSLTQIRLFFASTLTPPERAGSPFDLKEVIKNLKWATTEARIKRSQEVEDALKEILDAYWEMLLKPIKEKISKQDLI